jgi:hypothetical protein
MAKLIRWRNVCMVRFVQSSRGLELEYKAYISMTLLEYIKIPVLYSFETSPLSMHCLLPLLDLIETANYVAKTIHIRLIATRRS